MRYRIVTQDEAVGQWVHERTGGCWIPDSGAIIGVYRDDAIVAGLTFTQWTGANIFLAVAVEDKRAVTREFVFFGFWYAFEQLQCRRITALVDESNSASVSAIEHLGFTREATLSDAAPDGDVIVYRMMREEGRKWLSMFKRRAA